jgi:hypothetical protein
MIEHLARRSRALLFRSSLRCERQAKMPVYVAETVDFKRFPFPQEIS